ncbi:heat repeat-containing protein 3-like [Plakobranchus ocellatus]|uniref:Heat repeat-containing protein 3-like n=1 Tax=Plakobranchus ocellatus TaxID=259542 RepID=A0AAV4C5R4_9GAST|nr:heat repeat-containing protein 3-like [Plakobranchus ocellatus]
MNLLYTEAPIRKRQQHRIGKECIEAFRVLGIEYESSAAAVHWFNKENLLAVLLPLLKVETYGYPLSTAVARCFHVVSENNIEVTSVCTQQDVLSGLFSLLALRQPGIDNVLFRTLITGILLNLPDVDLSQYYKDIVAATVDALDTKLTVIIESALEGQHQADEELSFDPELTWPAVDKLISAQGVSLELLANLCCTDGEWEDAEDEESSDDQAVGASSLDVDMTGDAPESLCLPSELNSAFLEQNILSKILSTASSTHPDLLKRLEASQCGKTTLIKLSQLRQRALLCLGNLVEAVDASFLSQSVSLTEIWGHLYKLTQAEKENQNEDMKWALTCALRAVIQRLEMMQLSNLCDMSESDLDFLVSVGTESTNREIQINVLRILSTIACMMSQQRQLTGLFKRISETLLEVATKNPDVVIVSEALDSLFDVFKEDHTDPIAKHIGLVDKLRSLQPSFKAMIAREKKKLGENSGVVMMAKANLQGFIKYKLSQR